MKQTIHELARLLALNAKRSILSGSIGTIQTATAGNGLDFHELRDYQPEDDARYLHWPTLHAPGGPKFKVYQEEQDISDCIALDVSASMTANPLKWTLAAEASALLAAVATLCGNGGILMLFSHKLLQKVCLDTGNHELDRATEIITRAQRLNVPPTDLKQTLTELDSALHKPHRIFLISDFLDTSFQPALHRLAHRHDAILCQILPELQELPLRSAIEAQDAETGRRLVVNADSQREHVLSLIEETRQAAQKTGARHLHFTFSMSPFQTLWQLSYQNDISQL